MSHTRRYSDDFKKDAIQYVETHPDMTIQQTADYLGMPKETLYGWIKAYRRKLRNGDDPITGHLMIPRRNWPACAARTETFKMPLQS